ncbi:hypothetical protein [Streptacidiphilus sp. PAMC 29251]
MAVSAAPFAIIMVGDAIESAVQFMGGPGFLGLLSLAIGIEAIAVGGALGLLPGLAVGAALALAKSPVGLPQEPTKTPSHPGRAAFAASTAFFAENLVITFASGESFWILICFFGTPVAAVLAAALAKRIQG